MNILFILADNPINSCGGLGERFYHLLPKLPSGINSLCLTIEKSGKIGNTRVEAVENVNLSGQQRLDYITEKYLDIVKNLNFKPDVVLCTDWGTIPMGLKFKKIFECKLIVEFDLALFAYQEILKGELNRTNTNMKNLILDLEKMGIECSDKVITCSKYYENFIDDKYKFKVFTVQNGINIENWNNDLIDLPDKEKNNFLYIGRFNRQKGFDNILKLNMPENSRLYFAGPQRGSDLFYEMLYKCSMEPDKFSYLGYLDYENKTKVMNAADCVLFPSLHEPFGIVGLEAFVSNSVLITTASGGISEYANENNSIIVDTSLNSLQESTDSFCSMKNQDKQILLENGKNTVKNFDWNNLSNKFNRIITEW